MYGQIEINNAAFRRDGRIEAQCDIGTGFTNNIVENGMVVSVDKVNGVIIPYADAKGIAGIVYSAEHQYDEREGGLGHFAIKKGAAYEGNNVYVPAQNVYPRVGLLAVGDIYTISKKFVEGAKGATVTPNGTKWDGTEVSTKVAAVILDDAATMPDGTPGVKIQITMA